jgi:hypothetical protein
MSNPWELLRLPKETPAQQKRREEIRDRRLAMQAVVEANLRKLLIRRGEEEYNPDRQVVELDGYRPLLDLDIGSMTKQDLCVLAKGHIKGYSTMKVGDLRGAILKYIEENPGKITIGANNPPVNNAILPITVPPQRNEKVDNQRRTAPVGDDIDIEIIDQTANDKDEVESEESDAVEEELTESTSNLHECSVQECDYEICRVVKCKTCDLWFCESMHLKHTSHLLMNLRPGKTPRAGSWPTPLTTVVFEYDNNLNKLNSVVGSKRKSLDTIVDDKVDSVVKKISSIINKPTNNDNKETIQSLLRSTLNYDSYDCDCLHEVAKQFEVNLTDSKVKLRSRASVMEYLIDKILLKFI